MPNRSELRKKSRHAATPPGGIPGQVLVKSTEKDYEFEWAGDIAGGVQAVAVKVPYASGDFLTDFNNMPTRTVADLQVSVFYYPFAEGGEGVSRLWIGPTNITVGVGGTYNATWPNFHLLIQEEIDGGNWNTPNFPGNSSELPEIIVRLKRSHIVADAPTSLRDGELAVNPTDKWIWVGDDNDLPILLNGHQTTDVNTFVALTDETLQDLEVWDAVNQTNFGGHPQAPGTALTIQVNDVWLFEHNNLTYTYLYNIPDDHTVGLSGNYTTTVDDFYAVHGSPVQEVKIKVLDLVPTSTIEADINGTDFLALGQNPENIEGTALRFNYDEVWIIYHGYDPYIYIGVKNVTVGQGGNYTTIASDYKLLVNLFDVKANATSIYNATTVFIDDFNSNNFSSVPDGNLDGSLHITPQSVWVFQYPYDDSIRLWIGPKDVLVGMGASDYVATINDFFQIASGIGTREYVESIADNGGGSFLSDLNLQDFTGSPLVNSNGSLVIDLDSDLIFDYDLGNSYRWIGSKNVIIGGTLPQYVPVAGDVSQLIPILDAGYY
ncbi:MAG: hypothetical protein DRQ54_05000 [Gammaproteobacteria bacterium]|nr:MAG: hypothetical protein DRQ54_05000 [Gammaproteobacteria bacterium]